MLCRNDDPNRFVLYEVYTSESGFAAHQQTAHNLKWKELVAPMMAGAALRTEVHERVPRALAMKRDVPSAASSSAHHTRVVLGTGVWAQAQRRSAAASAAKLLLVTGAASLSRLGLEAALSDEARRLGLVFSSNT